MKKIAVKRNDGGVSIIIPTPNADPKLLERDAKAVVGYVSHREINDNVIPQDRTFRNAWTDDYLTDTIDINMPKAIEIHKNKLRELRKPKLEKLDVDYMLADEKGDAVKKAEIAKKKQALRDVTIQTWPSTPDELKTFIPAILTDV